MITSMTIAVDLAKTVFEIAVAEGYGRSSSAKNQFSHCCTYLFLANM